MSSSEEDLSKYQQYNNIKDSYHGSFFPGNYSRSNAVGFDNQKTRLAGKTSGIQKEEPLNVRKELKKARNYKFFYLLIGAYSMITSMLTLPLTATLADKFNVEQSESRTIRQLFYIPRAVKPLFAFIGDIIYPKRFKVTGWAVILFSINFVVSLVGAIFLESETMVLTCSFLLYTTTMFLDALGQGLAAYSTEFYLRAEQIKRLHQNDYADNLSKSIDSKNGASRSSKKTFKKNKTTSSPISTTPKLLSESQDLSLETDLSDHRTKTIAQEYVKNYGYYSMIVCSCKALFMALAFIADLKHAYRTLLFIVSFVSLIYAGIFFCFSELKEKNWVLSCKEIRIGLKKLCKNIRECLCQNPCMTFPVVAAFLVLSASPINYFNEPIINNIMADDRKQYSSILISACCLASGVLILLLIWVVIKMSTCCKLLNILLVILLAYFIALLATFSLDMGTQIPPSTPFLLECLPILFSLTANSLITGLSRLGLVSLFLKSFDRASFGCTLVNLLTDWVNIGQIQAKYWFLKELKDLDYFQKLRDAKHQPPGHRAVDVDFQGMAFKHGRIVTVGVGMFVLLIGLRIAWEKSQKSKSKRGQRWRGSEEWKGQESKDLEESNG